MQLWNPLAVRRGYRIAYGVAIGESGSAGRAQQRVDEVRFDVQFGHCAILAVPRLDRPAFKGVVDGFQLSDANVGVHEVRGAKKLLI